jgi:hypothetical protein
LHRLSIMNNEQARAVCMILKLSTCATQKERERCWGEIGNVFEEEVEIGNVFEEEVSILSKCLTGKCLRPGSTKWLLLPAPIMFLLLKLMALQIYFSKGRCRIDGLSFVCKEILVQPALPDALLLYLSGCCLIVVIPLLIDLDYLDLNISPEVQTIILGSSAVIVLFSYLFLMPDFLEIGLPI